LSKCCTGRWVKITLTKERTKKKSKKRNIVFNINSNRFEETRQAKKLETPFAFAVRVNKITS
jgi:hypothetical protein